MSAQNAQTEKHDAERPQDSVEAMEDELQEPIKQAPPDLTPYRASQIFEEWLHKHGQPDAKVRPQPFYGYSKRGVIASRCDLGTAGHRSHEKCENVMFDGADFSRWLKAQKNRTTRSSVDIAKLAEQYA